VSALRVGHLTPVVGRTGSEAHLLVLFEGLRQIGVEPVLLCPEEGPLTGTLMQRGFEVRVAAPQSRAGLGDLARTARALRDLDLLHSHGPRAQWWGALLRRSGAVKCAVATLHELGRSGAGSRAPRRWFDGIESWTLRSYDRVIAVSSFMQKRLVREAGVRPARVDVVLNSCPLLLDPPRERIAPAEPRHAYAAARLQQEKGLDVLVEALALLATQGKTLPVEVAGEGLERPVLEALARDRGVADRITFPGWVSDSTERMRRSWFYVNASRDEPCSVAIVEAMALGIPVVATSAGGNPELLAGTAVPEFAAPGNAAELARGLAAMMEMSAEAVDALRSSLQKRAYDVFGPGPMARATLAVYERVLGAAVGVPR
jgi:glycosyltransferase involved in cell wall biosynthesis